MKIIVNDNFKYVYIDRGDIDILFQYYNFLFAVACSNCVETVI